MKKSFFITFIMILILFGYPQISDHIDKSTDNLANKNNCEESGGFLLASYECPDKEIEIKINRTFEINFICGYAFLLLRPFLIAIGAISAIFGLIIGIESYRKKL